MNKAPKTISIEDAFPSFAIVTVLILSLWGAAAMLGGSIIGLATFVLIYRKRLRTRGWLTAAIAAAASAALAAAVVIAVSLIQPR